LQLLQLLLLQLLLLQLLLLQLLLLQLPGCVSVVPPADSLTASSRSSMRLFLNT
jgi:hypothetical protein